MRAKRFLPALTALLLLLVGCAPQAESLGDIAYTGKTLDGIFYSYGEELHLLSGTEVSEGGRSQVFVYNVDRDELVMSQHLEDCSSMTAFCEVNETLYFATITASAQACLYAWDKTGGEIRPCASFQEKGIYCLFWDGGDELFAATSNPVNLYAYHLESGTVRTVCVSPTKELVARSMSGGGNNCILASAQKPI